MKILYIHNDYARPSGEENAAEAIVELLREHGHEVRWFRRSSAELKGISGKIKGFLCGLGNHFAANALAKVLDEYRPDLVQVQNLYPLLSPSIFRPLRQRRIPVVMRCPNYRLFCPNGLCCDRDGRVCELCFGGHEWHCLAKNCAGSRFKSLGYALRGYAARRSRRILDGVDVFAVQTEFQMQKFIRQGIPAEKLAILPGIMQNMVPAEEWGAGRYVAYIGRVSEEKGILEFLECARRLPEIPFVVAGSFDSMPELPENAPDNVEWLGFLKGDSLREVFLRSRIVVVPSRCYEGFPNVIVQAMQLARPVIAVDLGASGAVVEEGVTGLKFAPGDLNDLTAKVRSLYADETRCRTLGENGRRTALRRYSRESIYAVLTGIYRRAGACVES